MSETIKISRATTLLLAGTLAVGLLLGYLFFGGPGEYGVGGHDKSMNSEFDTPWTCSMHPQIKRAEPGDCPICGMDLTPLESTLSSVDPMAVSMSEAAMRLAHVQTMIVSVDVARQVVRLNGKIQADERFVYTQSSHMPGRVEELHVNFVGEFVSKGQVIALVYSPELVTAQVELFQARKIKEEQPKLYEASIAKLKNWKLTVQQIDKVLASGTPIQHFPILADVSGYVTRRMVNLGDYLSRGQAIFEISDLSRVWVLFDVYESDLPWVVIGGTVSYSVQSIPGKMFRGTITFVDPVIDPRMRVAKARLEVRNQGLVLKPEMLVSGSVESIVGAGSKTIVVPKTAVMWTGKRSVVYVMRMTTQGASFLMREVTLGPELGSSFVIEAGLEPGEEIAVSGTFGIDAAAQLAGKPSMMNPSGGAAMTGHNHGTESKE